MMVNGTHLIFINTVMVVEYISCILFYEPKTKTESVWTPFFVDSSNSKIKKEKC